MRRIENLKLGEPFKLTVYWRDGGIASVDMAGVIGGFDLFAPLKDLALFATAKAVNHGGGIGWDNGLDFSADSLQHLADEQMKMSGNDFTAWQRDMGLSIAETADLFGVGVTTIKAYRKLELLPPAIQIACRAMRRDRETFFAHYRPRITGRPKKNRPSAAAE